ncbi:Anthranilate phosphoribosyltransferase [Chlamydiales bacterium SCGC AG-110-P3]|nr:Anthranilate phosphoribosyltransferase [Chlamydiales bacterium SCGC AG-110-P3]
MCALHVEQSSDPLLFAIQQLIQGLSVSAETVVEALLAAIECAPSEQTAAFLALLEATHPTAETVAAMTLALRKQMIRVSCDQPVLDIVGTGGDGSNTVNISTAAALVASTCGAPTVKHGNRAVSSRCGSADFIEALKIPMASDPKAIRKQLDEHRFAFCFAPLFHPALRKLTSARKGLGVRTVINLMGPLLNPAGAQYLLLGVGDPANVRIVAEVVTLIGVQRAYVFHSCGLDELSGLGTAEGYLIEGDLMTEQKLVPEQCGIGACSLEALAGGDAETNKQLVLQALGEYHSPISDVIAFNAGMGLHLSGHANTIIEGVEQARNAMETGAVLAHIDHMCRLYAADLTAGESIS